MLEPERLRRTRAAPCSDAVSLDGVCTSEEELTCSAIETQLGVANEQNSPKLLCRMSKVGQNHTFMGICSEHTGFIAGKFPYIRSYTVCIYGSGQP